MDAGTSTPPASANAGAKKKKKKSRRPHNSNRKRQGSAESGFAAEDAPVIVAGGAANPMEDDAVYKFINEKAKISLAKERKAARTMTIIVSTFVVCWLPFFLMYVIIPFCGESCYISNRVRCLFARKFLKFTVHTHYSIVIYETE